MNIDVTISQIILPLAPPLLLVTTFIWFRFVRARFGRARGYLYGFLFYWVAWCLMLPLLTLGASSFLSMFSAPDPTFGRPSWVGFLGLIIPPLSVLLTQFPKRVKSAGLAVILYSAIYALMNGTLEEILWRGTYVVIFSDSLFWGVIYPSIWFGLWHLSPQVVEAGGITRGTLRFAMISIILGLMWGWIAWSSGSIRLTVLAHILLNFAGFAGSWFIPQAITPET